jgi:hypothetical protein
MRGIIMRPRKFNMHDLSQLFPIPLLYGPVIVRKTVITKHLFLLFWSGEIKGILYDIFQHFFLFLTVLRNRYHHFKNRTIVI